MKLTEENYVETAEKAIKEICGKKDRRGRTVAPVTTSKIRNLLAMTAAIYNDVIVCTSEKLSTEIVGRIQYMKIRFVYEAGREPVSYTHLTLPSTSRRQRQMCIRDRYMRRDESQR